MLMLLLYFYGLIGLLFAFAFLQKGVHKVDKSAKDASWGVKVVLFPGVVLLWPVLLFKWIKK